MYLSALQKHILKTSYTNMKNENLDLNSEAFESNITSYSNLTKAESIRKKMKNGSIQEYVKLKTKLESLIEKFPCTQISYIEPNSNGSAHIYFYEPITKFFNLKLKNNLKKIDTVEIYKADTRKFFEVCKRKFVRPEGSHKKGIIRGEWKKLKAAKASISRTFKTLVKKKYLRKIDILDYESFKIGIGFNLTRKGYKTAKPI